MGRGMLRDAMVVASRDGSRAKREGRGCDVGSATRLTGADELQGKEAGTAASRIYTQWKATRERMKERERVP
jgi:hypothetical protein